MQKLILLILISFTSIVGKAQYDSEIGCMAGMSYYMGDINPTKIFYKPNFMFSGMYRYNFNDTYALRVNFCFGTVEADDSDFNNGYQQSRLAKFKNDFTNFNVNLEYNFNQFWVPKTKWTKAVVPFVSVGLGYVVVRANPTLSVPMTVGVKSYVFKNITIGLEWNYTKTFIDSIDDLDDPRKTGESSKLINNDWIAYCAVTVAYRFTMDKVCMLFNKTRNNGVGYKRY